MNAPSSLVAVLCVIALFLSAGFAEAAPAKVPVLVDTDIGDDIDDALALALVLSSPELDLRGVTTVHGDAYTRATFLCRFLHAVRRRDVPVSAWRDPRQ